MVAVSARITVVALTVVCQAGTALHAITRIVGARIAIIAIGRGPTGALPRHTAIVYGAGIAVIAGNIVSFGSEAAIAADRIASTLQAGCVYALRVCTANGGVGLHHAQMR
jgi:hypothetical protein